MNTDFSGYTNSVNSDLPSNGETEQLENSALCVTKQIEIDENCQSHSSLEVNVSQPETEGSASNGDQNTESINGDKTQGSVDEEKDEGETEEWLDILGSGQLKKKILKRAESSYRPQRSHICEINLEGRLPDGTIVDKHDHLSIQIGDAEVVQGLDLALPLMDVGEVALLEIGPRFAYGALGREPDVPRDATVVYTVELLSADPEPDVEVLPATKRKEIGCRKRERGNWWYSRQEHTLAIQCYRRALDYLDDIEGGITLTSGEREGSNQGTEEELHDLLEDRLKVYNNLAAAQMKIKAHDTALQSVENVLRCQPNNVKALFRKGKILAAKGENPSAVAALRLASQLEPDNRMIRQELLRILRLHKEDTVHEKKLYKKMLGQDKPPDSLPKNDKDINQLSPAVLRLQLQVPWAILFGTLAVLVAGVVAYRYKFL
ncbi:peptidyl-prolyl cis-trans isomerase FKBP8-like isoform X3 [Zootermopsis nevadensis]|uniref:peptidylprolyl isomerase n=2 Tax=Zootermopsis nevadensis TaxID=136037 RepID=A0A067R311_ZOONE|nr:peptidyl-prolyl cis-trans isomerase FKBP8-like isoform X3 [Zootermopsis nevadensis]XP_021933340.1 peptidyl-prolyl cis-trans isomerase FKBP8-like isoform X3 [Zootermopsis nevadensis]KDR12172.1 FK506-binding protein 8 [Zootermopsis nevadensis]